MEFIKLKSEKVFFTGAFLLDENSPVVAKLELNTNTNKFFVFNFNTDELILESQLKKINYEQMNEYLSQINIFDSNSEYIFLVGIFPHESKPIDNVSESILETFEILNQKDLLTEIKKNYGHSLISYMVEIINKKLSKS